VENVRFVEAVEIFHSLYIPDGPYKSNVPRLVREIVERLEGGDEMRLALLSMFGKRGAAVKEAAAKKQASLSCVPVPVQLTLWEDV
jgi:hypothetical protein